MIWTKKSSLIKSLHFFFMSANFKTIFKIWFVFFDWLFSWKWYAVINNKTIFKWLNVTFQKTATNFLFRSNKIARSRSHFFLQWIKSWNRSFKRRLNDYFRKHTDSFEIFICNDKYCVYFWFERRQSYNEINNYCMKK